QLQRPPRRTERDRFVNSLLGYYLGRPDRHRRETSIAIQMHVDVLVMDAAFVRRSLQRRQHNPSCLDRSIALAGKRRGALPDIVGEILGSHGGVDQTPLFRTLAPDAVGTHAENVGMIAASGAFVGHPSQAV